MIGERFEVWNLQNNPSKVKKLDAFIREESWGADYPIDALDLLSKVEYCAVSTTWGFFGRKLIGCGCITRYRGCPDDYSDTNLWFIAWAVKEKRRGHKIGTTLLTACVSHAERIKRPDEKYLYASTDDDECEKALLSVTSQFTDLPKLEFYRHGQNENGKHMTVWRLAI